MRTTLLSSGQFFRFRVCLSLSINMATTATEKPTVVRVKRKRYQAPIESIWLEVTDRPTKRHEVKFAGLSLDNAAVQTTDGGIPTMSLFRRLDTLSFIEAKDLSLPELLLKVNDKKRSREKLEPSQPGENKDKQEELLVAERVKHEESSKQARFEQILRSQKRRQNTEQDDSVQELFNLYDVVRVDVEAESAAKAERREQAKREAELEEGQLLCNYMPLLREILPSVAAEVDSMEATTVSTTTEEYEYDVYTLDEEMEDACSRDDSIPIIHITNCEDYDWREVKDPDYDSEDSNDENNPDNDYPEEEDGIAPGDGYSSSGGSEYAKPYGVDNEEYDLTITDDEEDVMWKPRR